MVEGVNAVAGSTVQAPDYSIPAEEPPDGELGKDAFLKLLVAQLKYQDPLEPSTSEEFIATTAQFTVVEKLDELTKQGANTALVNSLATASALVGRQVTASRSGVPVTAVVQQSRIVSGEVVLDTDQGSIGMAEIVSVGPAPASEPSPAQNRLDHRSSPDEAAESAPTEAPPVEPASVETGPPEDVPVGDPAVEDVTVAPAVEAERTPVPEPLPVGATPQPTPIGVPVTSATPASVEDADHTGDAALSDPFDAA